MTDVQWREREQVRLCWLEIDRLRATRATVVPMPVLRRGPKRVIAKETPKTTYAALQSRLKASA